ncbi:MAG: DUF1963 domain-containing protein [Kofleriaceae bacterium]
MTEIWISTRRTEAFARGQSRIGGVPDLPIGTVWPRHRWLRSETDQWPDFHREDLKQAIERGEVLDEIDHVALALPFVAQLDLAELASLQTVLPRTGHLWLFADQQTTLGEIGNCPYQASACLYVEHATLERATPPPTPDTLPALALTFSPATLGAEQGEPGHALLPDHFEGLNGDVPVGYAGLLRVGSDYTLDDVLNWGDAAWITFAIPPDALAARRFDEVRAFRFCG